ncbi:MaoC/PaaZ C-terminal domain-containing protein [Microbacterium sp. NIBRBAC000506063]|uniref:MaoC/PaaZ C-terminal domain-containing protein n=1 Tax=Microbacterium sp. NIBRBAC000506063 TaxID=2734618 RepID=UPI001BB72331|nr:MaoC/PaaZ C-terminal domain-containing protein [Microbacterium sp. NIBRBAC000506063]QTV79091.1 MaoC family dehydratase N-terminal domain-containing protein [Microbacterium sp. NIBRBAC000506063]
MSAGEWAGRDLGERTVSYTHRDAILYALAVGARADELDLVFEERLRVLPAFGLTLAQWAPDVLADAGAFDDRAVHGSQTLRVHKELPREGELRLAARVGDVWDKGSAAVFDVIVECDYFTATWSLFAPGFGGFGGERGSSRPAVAERPEPVQSTVQTFAEQAVLYRLTGDRHHIHVDPEASAGIGQPTPILHGLCTLAATALSIARQTGAHPAELAELAGRFSGPVIPGDALTLRNWEDGAFELRRGETVVISEGRAVYA